MLDLSKNFTGKFLFTCCELNEGQNITRIFNKVIVDLDKIQFAYIRQMLHQNSKDRKFENLISLCLDNGKYKIYIIRDELSEKLFKLFENDKI